MKKRWLWLGGLVIVSVGAGLTAKRTMAQATASAPVPGLDFKASAGGNGLRGWEVEHLRLERSPQNGIPGLTFRVGAGDRASGKGTAETPFATLPPGPFIIRGQVRGNLQFNPKAELYVLAWDAEHKPLARFAAKLPLTPGYFVPEAKMRLSSFTLPVHLPPAARQASLGVALQGSGFVTLRQVRVALDPPKKVPGTPKP